jgi:hypothetical protein
MDKWTRCLGLSMQRQYEAEVRIEAVELDRRRLGDRYVHINVRERYLCVRERERERERDLYTYQYACVREGVSERKGGICRATWYLSFGKHLPEYGAMKAHRS